MSDPTFLQHPATAGLIPLISNSGGLPNPPSQIILPEVPRTQGRSLGKPTDNLIGRDLGSDFERVRSSTHPSAKEQIQHSTNKGQSRHPRPDSRARRLPQGEKLMSLSVSPKSKS